MLTFDAIQAIDLKKLEDDVDVEKGESEMAPRRFLLK